MRCRGLISVFILLLVSMTLPGRAQEPEAPSDGEAPLLTADEAVDFALQHNRLARISELEAEKYDFRVSTIRSRRLPKFQFAVLSGELMHSFDFTFHQGVFGTYPVIGPVPATRTVIRTPAQLTTFVTGSIDQPITQQYKIRLGIRATELGREIAREDIRAQRQKVAAEVRAAYFSLIATQAGVEAARQAVQTLEEAQRITREHEEARTVLRADALEVEAKLARSRYDLSMAEDGLATQHEHLNQLLGRELATPFRVASLPEAEAPAQSIEEVRQRALENRPEVRQARIKEAQAEYDCRLARAEHIPDLSLSVRYLGMNNMEVLPGNVAMAGVMLTWEPFDWGRRSNAVAEKSKTVEQAHHGTRETESQVALEAGMKYRKWHEAALLLQAARATHQAAAEQVRVMNNRYGEQAVTLKDLLQAQARSAEAAFQYQQALSSYWSALAELRRVMGEE
jgi:outer membrane protein TolC